MNAIATFEKSFRKTAIPAVRSGDTVRVTQQIKEGGKTRLQAFEGVVIRTHRMNELSATVTVRRIASGVGVEKTYLLHSPNVTKVQVLRRGKVRRNFLSYLRERRGKSARLTEIGFDKEAVNVKDAPKDVAVPGEDEVADSEITELATDTDSISPDESTDREVKEEAKQAAAEDEQAETDSGEAVNEEAVKAEEAESGEARAEDEDTRNQKPVE